MPQSTWCRRGTLMLIIPIRSCTCSDRPSLGHCAHQHGDHFLAVVRTFHTRCPVSSARQCVIMRAHNQLVYQLMMMCSEFVAGVCRPLNSATVRVCDLKGTLRNPLPHPDGLHAIVLFAHLAGWAMMWSHTGPTGLNAVTISHCMLVRDGVLLISMSNVLICAQVKNPVHACRLGIILSASHVYIQEWEWMHTVENIMIVAHSSSFQPTDICMKCVDGRGWRFLVLGKGIVGNTSHLCCALAGGYAVLKGLQKGLGLPAEKVLPSFAGLREYGNTRSDRNRTSVLCC